MKPVPGAKKVGDHCSSLKLHIKLKQKQTQQNLPLEVHWKNNFSSGVSLQNGEYLWYFWIKMYNRKLVFYFQSYVFFKMKDTLFSSNS